MRDSHRALRWPGDTPRERMMWMLHGGFRPGVCRQAGYSSVGRASDCRMLQQSDGPWFDSGWPDFFEQRLAGNFREPHGHANMLSIAPVAFTRTTCTEFVQLVVCNRPPRWRVVAGSRPMVGELKWWRGGTLSTNRLAKWQRNGSPHWGLNPGPSVYKTDALPLSYRGQ